MDSEAINPPLFITRHARLRLHQRFPDREQEVVQRCKKLYSDIRGSIGISVIHYKSDNLVAVIAYNRLVTVYKIKAVCPAKKRYRRRYPRLARKRVYF
ncbi:MAG: hypothetical protein ABW148_17705 [Sedimenticola sp.]